MDKENTTTVLQENQEEIMVSVSCMVYNHEKYIGQCLEGFIRQKTNFKFEVLVHDDASTDHSADIIIKIKPIFFR